MMTTSDDLLTSDHLHPLVSWNAESFDFVYYIAYSIKKANELGPCWKRYWLHALVRLVFGSR